MTLLGIPLPYAATLAAGILAVVLSWAIAYDAHKPFTPNTETTEVGQ